MEPETNIPNIDTTAPEAPVVAETVAAPVAPMAPAVGARPDRGQRDQRGGARGGRRDNRRGPRRDTRPKSEFDQKIVSLRRVTRVTSGGRRFAFAVCVVAGNRKGMVGVGQGKAG